MENTEKATQVDLVVLNGHRQQNTEILETSHSRIMKAQTTLN